MTASIESIADNIVGTLGRDWLFTPSPAKGVLDFTVDGRSFRILVLDEAQDIDGIAVYRVGDVTDEEAEAFINDLTATEAAQVAKAQSLAAESEESEDESQ